jgi:predicted metal-dependent HD superfamily phosphohydrolase
MLEEARWSALWRRLGSSAPTDSFTELSAAYGEPHRHYHSAAHIAACLKHFDEWAGLAQQPELVELALWTHDLIYDTHRQDNEAASAERACAWLNAAGLEHHTGKVRELILATHHQEVPEDSDAALTVDIDLGILATDPATYANYERAIRAEYAWVPEPLFRAGRSKLLQHLLAMPRLYQHPPLAERWEAPARLNLAQALRALAD